MIRDMLRLVLFPWKMTTIIPIASIILVMRKREREKFGYDSINVLEYDSGYYTKWKKGVFLRKN